MSVHVEIRVLFNHKDCIERDFFNVMLGVSCPGWKKEPVQIWSNRVGMATLTKEHDPDKDSALAVFEEAVLYERMVRKALEGVESVDASGVN